MSVQRSTVCNPIYSRAIVFMRLRSRTLPLPAPAPAPNLEGIQEPLTQPQSVSVSVDRLKALRSFQGHQQRLTQLDHYRANQALPEILFYVGLTGPACGNAMEDVAREIFQLDKRLSSCHDHTFGRFKIEQKTARYHANGADWKWQHIELKHSWDLLMLTGIDYQSLHFYITTRQKVEELIELGVITGQGKKNKLTGVAEAQQGYWFSRSDFGKTGQAPVFTQYFQEVGAPEDLLKYTQALEALEA